MTSRSAHLLARSAALLALSGCVAAPAQPTDGADPSGCLSGKCDAINAANDPARLIGSFDANLASLPRSGFVSRAPWPGNAWRMSRDGIAWRWQGDDIESPIEKYARAFDDGRNDSVRWEREHHGTAQGEVGSWWGHCNGWAAAALIEPEPAHAVSYNGVRFEIGDIEGLVTEAYNSANARFLGSRCLSDTVERDAYGRAVRSECRDTNPGSFHIALANLLANKDRGFVMDFEAGDEVFNHVVVGYNVASLEEVDAATAARLVIGIEPDEYVGPASYDYNPVAERFFSVRTEVTFLPENSIEPPKETASGDFASLLRVAMYNYVLEVDRDGRIIGGEWTGRSRAAQPDFIWLPTGLGHEDSSNVYLDSSKVATLLRLSQDPYHVADPYVPPPTVAPVTPTPAPSDYCDLYLNNDTGEPDGTAAQAHDLGVRSDNDDQFLELSGTFSSRFDYDYYRVRITDDWGFLEPWVEVDGAWLNTQICAYYVYDDGTRANVACGPGYRVERDGGSACCGTDASVFEGETRGRSLALGVGTFGNGSGTIVVEVNNANRCGSYRLRIGA